ncbi:MAG: hypothetical protein NTV70_06475 [Acidobacteria bacterium]|nr:hypothetical protein [Acidobacteriota bacterium]
MRLGGNPYNWTLTGKVSGAGDYNRFSILAEQVPDLTITPPVPTVVPEPSFYAALAVGFSGLVVAVRWRN